jgi:hypothetical protein
MVSSVTFETYTAVAIKLISTDTTVLAWFTITRRLCQTKKNKYRTSLHNIQYKEFEDTKGVIRIRKSMTDRQDNEQKKKYKQRSTKHQT